MATSATPSARVYAVRVEYYSDRDSFAVETYMIEVPAGGDPMQVARARADDSIYFDPRVPGLSRDIAITPVEPEEPDDPDPAPPGGQAVKPVCPHCGSEEMVRDATARWDSDSQCWSISGVFDNETCDLCGAEGNCISEWVPADSESLPEAFLREVAAAVGDGKLEDDLDFGQFCLLRFRDAPVHQAAREWCDRASDGQA